MIEGLYFEMVKEVHNSAFCVKGHCGVFNIPNISRAKQEFIMKSIISTSTSNASLLQIKAWSILQLREIKATDTIRESNSFT